ncbi:MAG: methyltransferase domain-containing protein [Deltaproteobacteria bacterium]|nr:methyltransferase domain-containing protein [Deltaproteobacteria bacterium]
MPGSVEALHTEFFNALVAVLPQLDHLHYGLSDPDDRAIWGAPRRLAQGPASLFERLIRLGDVQSLPPGAVAVDVGCGLAASGVQLARRFGLVVEGINLTEAQVPLARARVAAAGLSAQVRVHHADGRAMPLPDSCADLALLVECAFHVPDKDRLMAEIARVLKPGGRLLVADQERVGPPLEVMGMFFFGAEGTLARAGEAAGLSLTAQEDVSAEIAAWMSDYARAGDYPARLGLAAWACVGGRPGAAAAFLRGSRRFDTLIRAELAARGAQERFAESPIRRLREHTAQELRDGVSRYVLQRYTRLG